MTPGKRAYLLLLLVPMLSGCSGFWQNPSTGTSGSGSCTSNCSSASSGDFYILSNPSSGTPEIAGESISSGKLTVISGSPWSLSVTPFAMTMGSGGNSLYVSTSAGVLVYPISSSALGTVATIDGTDVTADALLVDGSWLVEAVQEATQVTFVAIPIDTSTGSSAGPAVSSGYAISANNATVNPGQMTASPDGKTIFAALRTGGTAFFSFNGGAAATANPFGSSVTVIPVANSGGSALSVAVDPGQNVLYIGETAMNTSANSGGVRALLYSSLGSNSPTNIAGSPIPSGGIAPNFILPVGNAGSSSGSTPGYIYVANGLGISTAGNITSFAVASTNSSSYSISQGSTMTAGEQPLALAEDSSGAFLLEVNSQGSPYFSSYTFDAATAGQLDAQITDSSIASPLAIVAAPAAAP